MPSEIDELESLVSGAPPDVGGGPPGPPQLAFSSDLELVNRFSGVAGRVGGAVMGTIETVAGAPKTMVDQLAQLVGYPTAGAAALDNPTLTTLASPGLGMALAGGKGATEELKRSGHEKLAAVAGGATSRLAEAGTDPLMWVGSLAAKFPLAGRALQALLAKGVASTTAEAIDELRTNGPSEKFWSIVGGGGVDIGLIGGLHFASKAGEEKRPGAPPGPPVEGVRPPGPPEVAAPQGEAAAAPALPPAPELAPPVEAPAVTAPVAPRLVFDPSNRSNQYGIPNYPTPMLRSVLEGAHASLTQEHSTPHGGEVLEVFRLAREELVARGETPPSQDIAATDARQVMKNLGWSDAQFNETAPAQIARELAKYGLKIPGVKVAEEPGTGFRNASPEGRLSPEEVIDLAKTDEGKLGELPVVDLARGLNRAAQLEDLGTGHIGTTFTLRSAFRTAYAELAADSPLHSNSIVEKALAHTEGISVGGEDFAGMTIRSAADRVAAAHEQGIEPVVTATGAQIWKTTRGTWVTVPGPDGTPVAALQASAEGHVIGLGNLDRSPRGAMNTLRVLLALRETNVKIPPQIEQSYDTRALVRTLANALRVSPDELSGRSVAELISSDPRIAARVDAWERRLTRASKNATAVTEPAGETGGAGGTGLPSGGEPGAASTELGGADRLGEKLPGPGGLDGEDLRTLGAAVGGEQGGVGEAGRADLGGQDRAAAGVPGTQLPPGPPEGIEVAGGAPGLHAGGAVAADRAAAPGGEPRAIPPTAGNLALRPEPLAPPPESGGPPGAPSPFDSLTEPILRQAYHQEVTRVAGEVMTAAGIPWDRTNFPVLSDQLAYQINEGKIPMATLLETVQRNGMTLTEFTNQLWRPAITDAAQRLQALSALSQRLRAAEATLPPGMRDAVASALDGIGTQLDEFALMKNWWRRLDNVRRGLLVSQLSTTMRNVETQVARVGVGALTDSLDYALQHVLKAAGINIQPSVHPLEGWRILAQSTWSLLTFGKGDTARRANALTEFVLGTKDHPGVFDPKFHDRLFNVYSSDISTSTSNEGVVLKGADRVFSGLERFVDIVNVLNRGQEFIFRRAVFTGKLDGEIVARGGKGLAEAIEAHNSLVSDTAARFGPDWQTDPHARNSYASDPRHFYKVVDESMLNRSIDAALEMTFAETPKHGTAAQSFVQFVNRFPGATFILPFPRFMMNGLKFTFQYNPTGFLKLLSSAERAKIAQGDTTTLSKAILGTAMLAAAYQVRTSDDAGERWYQVNVKLPGTDKTRTLDIRPFNPFAAHFFIADIIARYRQNRLYTLSSQDIAEGVLSVNLRAGTGLALLDSFTKGATSLGATSDVKGAIGRFGGELLSGFLTPLQTFTDFFAQFDADSRIVRDRRIDPFAGAFASKIPGLAARTLPPMQVATRGGPYENEFPAVKQLTGLLFSDPQNPLEHELGRLQFAPNEIFRGTSSPQADALVKHYMGGMAEDYVVPVILSKEYQALSDGEKGLYLADLLSTVRKAARGVAISERPDLFADLRKKTIRQRLLEREIVGEQENAMAGQSPSAPPGPPE